MPLFKTQHVLSFQCSQDHHALLHDDRNGNMSIWALLQKLNLFHAFQDLSIPVLGQTSSESLPEDWELFEDRGYVFMSFYLSLGTSTVLTGNRPATDVCWIVNKKYRHCGVNTWCDLILTCSEAPGTMLGQSGFLERQQILMPLYEEEFPVHFKNFYKHVGCIFLGMS